MKGLMKVSYMESNNLDQRRLMCPREKHSSGDKDVDDEDSECSKKSE